MIDVFRQALFVVIIVALVLAEAGLGWFFLAQIPAVVLTLVITGWLVRRIMPLRPTFHPHRWWPLLRATFAYAIAVALNATYFRVAVVALSLLATERETSVFATAFRVIEVLIAVPALIVGAAFPLLVRAARDDHDRLDYAAGRLVDVSVVLGTWLALGLFLGAEPIIELLAGDGWEASVALLRIQSAALIATFLIVSSGSSCCLCVATATFCSPTSLDSRRASCSLPYSCRYTRPPGRQWRCWGPRRCSPWRCSRR